MPLFKRKRNSISKLPSYLPNGQEKEFFSRLKGILGFKPTVPSIYEKAFIHRSATLILEDGRRINNERLEFLGDAVLDTILSDLLFEKFPSADEGDLTKIRSKIVNREVLNEISLKMGIDKLLLTHINKKNGGKNLYGNALEALIGSIFLDKGYTQTKSFITNKLIGPHLNLTEVINTDRDYKSQVFQWVQKLNKQISFNHSEEYDPKNKKSLFTTTLLIDYEVFGNGSGQSKKEAEQEASFKALAKIRKVGYID